MKRYILVILAALSLFVLVACHSITEDDLEHAYGSGYEAGLEAAKEASIQLSPSSPLPVENREPTAVMVDTPNSSAFSAVGYSDGTLFVKFRDNGYVYSYEDVPQSVYNEMWAADSMGGYYNKEIKGYYECHRLS